MKEPHAHILCATSATKDCCAILIADDCPEGIRIRFLLSNLLDITAKGSGTFLVHHILERGQNVVTIPQNSEKFWNKLGFTIDAADRTQFIYRSVIDTTIVAAKKPLRKPHKK